MENHSILYLHEQQYDIVLNKVYKNGTHLQNEVLLDKHLAFFLSQMPDILYLKNRDSEFLGCSTPSSHLLKLKSPEEIIGKNNTDFYKNKNDMIAYDRKLELFALDKLKEIYILATTTYATKLLHTGSYKNKQFTMILRKRPFFDLKKRAIGLLSQHVYVNPSTLTNILNLLRAIAIPLTDKLINNIKQFTRENNQNIIHLSTRELECVYGLIHGFSAKKIARELDISNRTVETYINNIKLKFSCNSTLEVLSKIYQFGYLDYIPSEKILLELSYSAQPISKVTWF